MEKVKNIFKENNCSLKEFNRNTASFEGTNRISIEYINENEIILNVNMTGKEPPSSVEATFILDEKTTGELIIFATTENGTALSCMEIYTKSREIGRDVRLYMGKFCISVPLNNEDTITFKFTEYSNYGRSGKVRLQCI